jgi:hypothetical protein
MTNASWDDYKKTITTLTEDQIKVLEDEAKRVADELNKENGKEANIE